MLNVFLSASIPLPERDPSFFHTADLICIREAIKALVEVVLPVGRIVCGGHPAITPLLALFVKQAGLDRNRLTIYQSERFREIVPPSTFEFSDVRFVNELPGDRAMNLETMRRVMLTNHHFHAAVLIGGMEGVNDEGEMFSLLHPAAKIIPVASTGAAAAQFFQSGHFPEAYQTDLTYPSLFRRHLPMDGLLPGRP